MAEKALVFRGSDFTIELIGNQYILSVLCGTIGIYEYNVVIDLKDLDDIKSFHGNTPPLVEQIRRNPTMFSHREFKMPQN